MCLKGAALCLAFHPLSVGLMIVTDLSHTSDRFRFAAAVAAFGQQLRGGPHIGAFTYEGILTLARGARRDDPNGQRDEFLSLVQLAQSLSQKEPTAIQ